MKLVVTPIWQEFPRSGRTGKFPLEERGRGREGERERERERERQRPADGLHSPFRDRKHAQPTAFVLLQ
jgi:hypothetical protein